MNRFFNLLIILLFFFYTSTAQESTPESKTSKKQSARSKTGIILAGSSITWGDGSIRSRFSGKVVDFMLSGLSSILMCNEMSYSTDPVDFSNPGQYKGMGKKITGLHGRVSFDLFGDEIAVCQAVLRTHDFGVMTVRADGEIIGTFTNKNITLGSDKQEFTGDGLKVKFKLNYPYTYDHNVRVGGKRINGRIYDGGWSRKSPENASYLVVRKLNENKEPVHYIWFKHPPAKGEKITVRYKYGKVIMFEGSTVGQTTSDEINESDYGEGQTAFDTTKPAVLSSGLEYRCIDKRAFWIHKFTESRTRHYEIEITGGVNPYFIINFASNRYHDFMNAGIGGWSLKKYLDHDGINDYNTIFGQFLPDVIVMECATNDDWDYGGRKLKRVVSGLTEEEVKRLWTLELDRITYRPSSKDYEVRFCTGIIDAIDKYSLTCRQVRGSDVKPGDIIRIGTYHGDNRQVVCREITGVDTVKGRVSWLQPLNAGQILNAGSLEYLVGAECSVRDLSGYRRLYEEMIRKLQKIAPQAQLLIAQPGLSNYWWRQLWGYGIIHRELCAEFENVHTIEVTDWLQEFQSHNITGRSYIEIQADGSKEYELPWEGIWQGFQVWIGDREVYGRDCYIEGGAGYAVDQEGHGSELNLTRGYDKSHRITKNMRLVFTCNAPEKGTIRVVRADSIWSPDLCHTNEETGAYIYGQIYITRIRDVLH